MQRNKLSLKGQNIYVGIDVHLKTWHVTTVTESGYKYSFAQHSDARELFDRLNRKFPDAHFVSAFNRYDKESIWQAIDVCRRICSAGVLRTLR